jgi:hypothetical protein
MEQSIHRRRQKVQELSCKGYSQREIDSILKVGKGTINRDLPNLRQQAKENIKKYIDERLPEEYEKCLVGLNVITRELYILIHLSVTPNDDLYANTKALINPLCKKSRHFYGSTTMPKKQLNFTPLFSKTQKS